MRKGRALVIGFVLFAAAFLGLLLWFVFRTQELPDREQNILLSDSAPLIGDNAQILALGGDIDADGNEEGLLAQPVPNGHPGQVAKWLVIQRQGRKSKPLLMANANSLNAYTQLGDIIPIITGVEAPNGYVFLFDSAQADVRILRVALSDSAGQPASDVLSLEWNRDSARYVLQMP